MSININRENLKRKVKDIYINIGGQKKKIKSVWVKGNDNTVNKVFGDIEKMTNRFICIGDYGVSYYSTDGLTWTAMSGGMYSSPGRFDSTFGKNRFVFVGNLDTSSISKPATAGFSKNGESWTKSYIGLDRANYRCIAYGNSKFVCVSDGNVFPIPFYSSDGITWEKSPCEFIYGGGGFYSAISYGNNKFITISSGGYGYYSNDGIMWNLITTNDTGISGMGAMTGDIAYGNTKFVLVAGKVSYYSHDGIKWTLMNGIPSTNHMFSVTYGNGQFVCVGNDGQKPIAYYSLDAIIWNKMNGFTTHSKATSLRGVTYGNGIFVCVGDYGLSYYSSDGRTWISMPGLATSYYYETVAYSVDGGCGSLSNK